MRRREVWSLHRQFRQRYSIFTFERSNYICCLLLYFEYGGTFPRKFDIFLPDWMAWHSRRVSISLSLYYIFFLMLELIFVFKNIYNLSAWYSVTECTVTHRLVHLETRLSQISFLPIPTNCTSSYSLKTWLFRVTYTFRLIPKFMFRRRQTNAAETRGNRGRANNFIPIPNKSDCLSHRESASLPAFQRADVGFAWQAWNFVRGLHFRRMRQKYGKYYCLELN